ncbi:hypothetical protein JB92DRAFT_3309405 [Gautieria morchelliformis]|nr:hypothetical protein JB92DRAFT_3309405 [Gautieria morchelliformis]
MVFHALAVLVALPTLVLISPWVAKGAIEHEGQNVAAWTRTRLCEAGGPRLRVPHFGRDEGHAADASWASELMRRGGCIQFLCMWLDWDREKRLQDGLRVVLCTTSTNYDQNT